MNVFKEEISKLFYSCWFSVHVILTIRNWDLIGKIAISALFPNFWIFRKFLKSQLSGEIPQDCFFYFILFFFFKKLKLQVFQRFGGFVTPENFSAETNGCIYLLDILTNDRWLWSLWRH